MKNDLIARPTLLGLPYHGLVRNGQLAMEQINDEPLLAPPWWVEDEPITAPAALATEDQLIPTAWPIDMGQSHLVLLTSDPSGTTYQNGTDYTISASGITLLTAGTIIPGADLLFSYFNSERLARTEQEIYLPDEANLTSVPGTIQYQVDVDFIVLKEGILIINDQIVTGMPLLVDYTAAKPFPDMNASSFVVRHPSAPGDTRDQALIDADAARMRKYKDYLLVQQDSGAHVAGSALPAATGNNHTWIYIDPEGTPWVCGLTFASVGQYKTVVVDLVGLFGRFGAEGTVERQLQIAIPIFPGEFDPPEFENTILEPCGFSANETGSKAAYNIRERDPADYLHHAGEPYFYTSKKPPGAFGDRMLRAIYTVTIIGTGDLNPEFLGDGIEASITRTYAAFDYSEQTTIEPWEYNITEVTGRWYEGNTECTMFVQTAIEEYPGVSVETFRVISTLDPALADVPYIYKESDPACPTPCFDDQAAGLVYAHPRDGGAVITKSGNAILARIGGLVHEQPWGSGGDWDVGNLWAADSLKVATDPGEPAIVAEMTDDLIYYV